MFVILDENTSKFCLLQTGALVVVVFGAFGAFGFAPAEYSSYLKIQS